MFAPRSNGRSSWTTNQWCRCCGLKRPKAIRFCPQDHSALPFLPGFIEPQTNRLQHVFRDLELYGIPGLLGDKQWSLYKQHTSERYYEEWLLFFQRQPRKVIRCVGCVSGDPCPWGGHDVDMGAEPNHVKAALAVLQMDHSIPKRAICTQWRRLVEAHRTAHSAAETTPHFGGHQLRELPAVFSR